MEEEAKRFLTVVGVGLGIYALYKIVQGSSPQQAVKAPVKVVETAANKVVDTAAKAATTASKTVKKAAYQIKGSPEAKARMKELTRIRLSKKKKKSSTRKTKSKGKEMPLTDDNIIKKYKLKGKAKQDVLSGKVPKKKKSSSKKRKKKKAARKKKRK